MVNIQRVELFLDGEPRPRAVLERAPFRLELDTGTLAAGGHALRIEVRYGDGSHEERTHLFEVAAGEALALEDVGFVPGRGVLTIDLSAALEPTGWVPSRPVVIGLVVALLVVICGSVPVFMALGSRPVVPAVTMAGPLPGAPEGAAPGARGLDGAVDGASLYAAECASCHQRSGSGIADVFPALTGAAVDNTDSLLGIVLRGRGAMPSFANLADRDLAAVVTYVRGAWGNAFPPVEPGEVAARR